MSNFRLTPNGYRRYEVTTNKNQYLKYESQIPVEEYEAEHGRGGVDVVQNVLEFYQKGPEIYINPDCGVSQVRSRGGEALAYARRIFGGDTREKDAFYKQWNRQQGYTPSGIVQQATGPVAPQAPQFRAGPYPSPRMGQQHFEQPPYQPEYEQHMPSGNPLDDLISRANELQQLESGNQRGAAVLPVFNKNAGNRLPQAGGVSSRPSAGLPGLSRPQPQAQTAESVAEQLRQKREAMKNKVKITAGSTNLNLKKANQTVKEINFEEI